MAELEVFNAYFSNLVTSVQYCCLEITNQCLSKKLITRDTHITITTVPSTPGEKATKLLSAVGNSMKHQKDCFHKFKDILKDQLIFEKLVTRIERSVQEVKDRQVTAECTDDKVCTTQPGGIKHKLVYLLPKKVTAIVLPPISEPSVSLHTEVDVAAVRKTAIKTYLPRIKSAVQVKIGAVAGASRSKQLISNVLYRQIMGSKKSKKKQTDLLLFSICKYEHEDKFDTFLAVLENTCPSCKSLVVDIKQDISKKIESEKNRQSCTDKTKAPSAPAKTANQQSCTEKPIAQSGAHEDSKQMASQQVCTDKPIAPSGAHKDSKMVLGSGKVIDPKVRAPVIDPRTESEYFRAQERKQNEAKMRELKEDMSRNQQQLGSVSQEKTKLEEQLTAKDSEIMSLEERIGNLQLAEGTLKHKYAQSEKEKAKLIQVQSAISELQAQVSKIHTEMEEMRGQLNRFEEKFHHLQTGQDETKKEVRSVQKALQKLQASFDRNFNLKVPETWARPQPPLLDPPETRARPQPPLLDRVFGMIGTCCAATMIIAVLVLVIFQAYSTHQGCMEVKSSKDLEKVLKRVNFPSLKVCRDLEIATCNELSNNRELRADTIAYEYMQQNPRVCWEQVVYHLCKDFLHARLADEVAQLYSVLHAFSEHCPT